MKVAHGPLDHAQWRLIALQSVVALMEIREKLDDVVACRAINGELNDLLKSLWPVPGAVP